MSEAREIRCPETGQVVFLDVGILALPNPAPIYCPCCRRLHTWDPSMHKLRPRASLPFAQPSERKSTAGV